MPHKELFDKFDTTDEMTTSMRPVRLEIKCIGELILRSGSIVACDPLLGFDAQPFTQIFRPGMYPVDICIAHLLDNGDQRIAAARVRLKDTKIIKAKSATPQMYGVDCGTGCFIDAMTAKALGKLDTAGWERFSDDLQTELDKIYIHTRSWGMQTVSVEKDANLAVFSSGWGDGRYANYIGQDDAGEVSVLLTDFMLADILTAAEQKLSPKPVAKDKPWWKFWQAH